MMPSVPSAPLSPPAVRVGSSSPSNFGGNSKDSSLRVDRKDARGSSLEMELDGSNLLHSEPEEPEDDEDAKVKFKRQHTMPLSLDRHVRDLQRRFTEAGGASLGGGDQSQFSPLEELIRHVDDLALDDVGTVHFHLAALAFAEAKEISGSSWRRPRPCSPYPKRTDYLRLESLSHPLIVARKKAKSMRKLGDQKEAETIEVATREAPDFDFLSLGLVTTRTDSKDGAKPI